MRFKSNGVRGLETQEDRGLGSGKGFVLFMHVFIMYVIKGGPLVHL